jgi:hypothetical protein
MLPLPMIGRHDETGSADQGVSVAFSFSRWVQLLARGIPAGAETYRGLRPSGGGAVPMGAEGFEPPERTARLLYRQVRLSYVAALPWFRIIRPPAPAWPGVIGAPAFPRKPVPVGGFEPPHSAF